MLYKVQTQNCFPFFSRFSIYQTSSDQSSYRYLNRSKFSTSRQTLTAIPDTFFTALLSGRISSQRDSNKSSDNESGAIFIDRDPDLFRPILNFLRNRNLSLASPAFPIGNDESSMRALLHEAEYYGISPLVKQLALCLDLEKSSCGDVLFYGCLPPPLVPSMEVSDTSTSSPSPEICVDPLRIQLVKAHQSSIAVAYPYFVACTFGSVFLDSTELNQKYCIIFGSIQSTTDIYFE